MSKERVPYLVWRDGRPRWVPSPELRARGFRGQDLKDAAGNWLTRGAAIDAATALNASTRPPLAGAPTISRSEISGRGPATSSRMMNDVFDSYEASPHFTRRLAKRTQQGYAQHIKTLRDWCGDIPAAALKKPAIAEFHAALEETSGAAMANAVLRTLKIVLNYAMNDLEWLTRNPTKKLQLAETHGRLVQWSADEVKAAVAAADALELWSIGDAIILALLTCQRQGDVLTLRDGDFRDGKFVFRTSKTDTLLAVQASDALTLRITAARARKKERWPNVSHTAEVVCELTGAPYLKDGSYFRALFRMVRAVAAGGKDARDRVADLLGEERAGQLANLLPTLATAPSIADKQFLDLRDTGVTWLFKAGCTIAEIATVTGHALRTVEDILDKHYFVRDDALAQSAATKLNTYLAGQKW